MYPYRRSHTATPKSIDTDRAKHNFRGVKVQNETSHAHYLKMSTSGSGGVTVLATVPPLSKHQREFLRAHILKQRKQKAQEGKEMT